MMDEKKVREAIELLKEEIHVLEELESHIDIIEKQKKKHIGLWKHWKILDFLKQLSF